MLRPFKGKWREGIFGSSLKRVRSSPKPEQNRVETREASSTKKHRKQKIGTHTDTMQLRVERREKKMIIPVRCFTCGKVLSIFFIPQPTSFASFFFLAATLNNVSAFRRFQTLPGFRVLGHLCIHCNSEESYYNDIRNLDY